MKVCSLNIQGLNFRKLTELQTYAQKERLDFILLQETHLGVDFIPLYTQKLQPHWTCFWGPAILGTKQTRYCQGVAILVRTSLLKDYGCQCKEYQVPYTQPIPGRIISISVRFLGHKFVLSSVYLPVVAGPEFNNCLRYLVALEHTSGSVFWGGDFNFVAHKRDTDRKQYTPSINYQLIHWIKHMEQTSIVEVLQSQFQDQGYTRKGNRLDRFYCSDSMLTFFQKGKITTTPEVQSDHRPILCTILGRQQPQKINQGTSRRQRILTEFRKSPVLLQQFRHEAAKVISKEFRDISFNSWKRTKRSLSALALHFNQKYKSETQGQHARGDTRQVDALHILDDLPTRVFPEQQTAEGLWTKHHTLSRSGIECANILSAHYAHVSEAPDLDQHACEAILHVIPDEDTTIFPEYASEGDITEQDVFVAMKKLRPTAPGEDGIHATLYRLLRKELAGKLAILFNQLLTNMPPEFLRGIIIPIHKGGSKHEPQNYRPITLLNTDCKLFTSILMAKLKHPLQRLIMPCQSAFLPGRSIMDNLWMAQLLPRYLSLRNDAACIVFCDFEKAYDKISRQFLFALCDKLNMPPVFKQWIASILTNTTSLVHYAGYFSKIRIFEAGVRQGDPASPYLYLLIGHALARWIESCHLGLTIPLPYNMHHYQIGIQQSQPKLTTLSVIQYADDVWIPLPPESIPILEQVMQTFGAATGQRLNSAKSHILPIGNSYAWSKLRINSTIPVVKQAKILGIPLNPDGSTAVDWKDKLARYERKVNYIRSRWIPVQSKMYQISTKCMTPLLFAAEVEEPSSAWLEHFWKITRKALPSNTRWRSTLYAAKLKDGGMGCLHFTAHLNARYLKWFCKLFTSGHKLWVKLTWNIWLYIHKLQRNPVIHADITPLRFLVRNDRVPQLSLQGPTLQETTIDSLDDTQWVLVQKFPKQYDWTRPRETLQYLWDKFYSEYQGRPPPICPLQLEWCTTNTIIRIQDYTVAAGTYLFTTEDQQTRQQRMQDWFELILPTPPQPIGPSPHPPIEIFTDGSAHNQRGAGFGLVVYQSQTEPTILLQQTGFLGQHHTHNQAEYAGLVEALYLCLQNSWTNVTIKLDSKLVFEMVRKSLCRSNKLRWYHLTSLAILRQIPGVDIVWIPRTENTVADNLSKQACMDRNSWHIQNRIQWLQQEAIPLPFHLLSHPHTLLQPFTKLPISGFYTARVWNVLFKVQLDPSKTKIATTCICENHPTERFPGREHYFTTQCTISRSVYAFIAQKFQLDLDIVLGLLWTATPPYTHQVPQDVWTLIAVATFVSIDDTYLLQHRTPQKQSLRQYQVAAFTTLHNVLCRSIITLQPGDDSHAQLPLLHWRNNTWTLEDQDCFAPPD